ncbi:hypothetical protein ACA910_005176 [Epithemia clementina (nom. ined.)]
MTTMITDAVTAIGSLDKDAWAAVNAADRLRLLFQIRQNLYDSMDELGAAEAAMRNSRLIGSTSAKDGNKDEKTRTMYSADNCKVTTCVAMGGHINGALDLYKAIKAGKPFAPRAGKPTKVKGKEDLWDIPVCPNTMKETFFYATRSDKLRVQGQAPIQVGPYEKKTKIIAILGAGNFSSPVEIIKALFFDNCVAVHKPHPINASIDPIWARIFAPLVKAKVLAFTTHDEGSNLVQDPRVDTIYFTGSAETAKKIMSTTQTNFVCEAGGVSPTLIVPSDRWTDSQLKHHAQQLVTAAKANGGHVCARPQLIVTSKAWPLRQQFLDEIAKAAKDTTMAVGSYYPTAAQSMETFVQKYPNAQRFQPENGSFGPSADILWIPDDQPDGYAVKHEAFCQVLAEVALDTENNADDFLKKAVEYANRQVMGSLCAGILIDNATRKKFKAAYDAAVTDLEYGMVGVNLLPVYAFFTPYLAWGVNEAKYFNKKEMESGNGNFGNVFGFENVQKSIYEDSFVSPLQLKFCNKTATSSTIAALARYAVWPSWYGLLRFFAIALPGSLRGKDW